jgi:hypothetical protein
LRTIVVRLARAMGGGVDYWMELPIKELTNFMIELTDQLQSEHDASEDRR